MDIYFTPEWGKVNRYIEHGEPLIFDLKKEYGEITNQFILRKIPWLVDGKQYYDITTPYGYGGPIIVWCDDGRRRELLEEYDREFSCYCTEHDIVSEFIRFHPIFRNDADFTSVYNIRFDRHTVGTNLKGCEDPIREEFSKSARKNIRRAIQTGVTWEVIEAPSDIREFLEVYYSTMERDKASDFYYFPEDYFDECVKLFGNHIILVRAIFQKEIIAEGFYVTSEKTIHAHLSGTLKEYLYLSPAYIVKYATAVWGKEHGYELIHYGGGTSSSEDNSLYQFKLNFTKNTIFDFYVGKKVWNKDVYEALVEKRLEEGPVHDEWFFPRYRG